MRLLLLSVLKEMTRRDWTASRVGWDDGTRRLQSRPTEWARLRLARSALGWDCPAVKGMPEMMSLPVENSHLE